MEDAIADLKERVRGIPAKMATELSSRAERIEAARYLYWTQPELSGTVIAESLLATDVHQLLRLIGSATTQVLCDRCGGPVPFTSRTKLQEAIRERRHAERTGRTRYAEGYAVICDGCWAAVQRERHEEYQIRDEQVRARLRDLRAMPYREYLQTPEWQARRARHLKSAGFRCQVCNAVGVQLDVHHRTYERRGSEYFKDLIALCRTCHKLFHREGRLAHE